MDLSIQLRRFFLGIGLFGPTTFTVHAQAADPVMTASAFAGVTQQNFPLEKGSRFPVFDAAFYENQLFLLGEAHGVQRPQEIDLALFKHLNERAGVRTYVAEVDCSKAYYLNEYLRTGAETTLDLVFRSWAAGTAQWANQELRGKYQQIRVWNQALPQRRRIRFLGLDELQDMSLAGDYMTALLMKQSLPAVLRAQTDSIVSLLKQPGATVPMMAGVAKRAVAELTKQEGAQRKKLGSGYEDLLHVLRNVADNRSGMVQREQNIFANFQRLYQAQHLEREKLYGFWGLGHVLQSPLENGSAQLAAMLRRSDMPVRDKMVSLLCVFADCQMLMPSAFLPGLWQERGQRYSQTNKFSHDGPMVLIDGIQELKQRTKPGSTTLFALNAPQAATNQHPIRISYAPGVPAGQQIKFKAELPATAYVQYLILVRNSPAVQPLKP